MSSSRSNASAKNRRVEVPNQNTRVSQMPPPPSPIIRGGGQRPPQMQPQQMQPQQMRQPQQMQQQNYAAAPSPAPQMYQGDEMASNMQGPSKLSLNDAFALVTIRLGRVETFVQKMQGDNGETKVDSNKQLMNDAIIKNVLTRVEVLEKKPVLDGKVNQHDSSIASLKSDLEAAKQMIVALQNKINEIQDQIRSNDNASENTTDAVSETPTFSEPNLKLLVSEEDINISS